MYVGFRARSMQEANFKEELLYVNDPKHHSAANADANNGFAADSVPLILPMRRHSKRIPSQHWDATFPQEMEQLP